MGEEYDKDSELLRILINEDYKLLKKLNIPVTKEAQDLWLADTIEGHAHNGHSIFRGKTYPALTKEEIYIALRMDPNKKRQEREDSIYESRDCFEDLINGKINKLVNRKGAPLAGALFLEDKVIDACRESMKGAPLAGRMDSNYWRPKTIEEYPLTLNGRKLRIGSGREFIIDIKKLNESDLTKEKLSMNVHSKKLIDYYKKIGLILNELPKNKEKVENMFIRTSLGLGCCDDASLISMGKLHHPDALLIGWGIDAADTFTKFIKNPLTGGLDEWLGEEVMKMWREKYHEELVSPKETTQIIYIGAKNNYPNIVTSSSHRRFNQIEKKQKFTTIMNHYNFVKDGTIPKKYCIGFDKLDSNEFYDSMNQRFYLAGIMKEPKKEKIPRKIKDKILKIPEIKIKRIKKEPVKEKDKYYKKNNSKEKSQKI